MDLLLALAILASIGLLLGRATFYPHSDSLKAATEPVLRNYLWQIALSFSAVLMMITRLGNPEAAAAGVWLMAYLGIFSFALVCLVRTLNRRQAESLP